MVPDSRPPTTAAASLRGSALATAFVEHRGVIARYASRQTSDRASVEDRVQDVFERLSRSAVAEPIASWKALLLRVARSAIVDQARREKVRYADALVPLDDDLAAAASGPDPFEALVARDRLTRLKGAIMALDPIERDIVLLARLEGLSHKAIGLRLGIEAVTVSRTLYKTIGKLAVQVDGA